MPTTMSVLRTYSLFQDLDNDGQYDPGDTVMIRIRVTNTGTGDATNVSVTDTAGDAGTFVTIVNGSVDVTPIAFDDAYNLTGNTPISFTAAQGVLANDTDPDDPNGPPPNLVVSAVNGAAFGGNIDIGDGILAMNADGSFTFTPDTGFEGLVAFDYTARDAGDDNIPGNGDDGASVSAGTVSLTVGGVNGMVWYVDSEAAGGGDGSYAAPFTSLASLNGTANDGALTGDPDAAGHTIFVYNRATDYSTGVTLENNQDLIGGAITVNGINISGTGGETAVIGYGGGGATTYGVRLGQGNELSGFNLQGAANTNVGIVDNSGAVGALAVSNVGFEAGSLGQVIDVDQGGTLAVTLNNAISAGASLGAGNAAIDLDGVQGSFTVTGATTINGTHTGGGIDITNASAALTSSFSGNLTVNTGATTAINFEDNATGASVLNLAGGTKDIDTTSGAALRFVDNNGATINITGGGLDVDSTTGTGLTLTNAGVTSSTLNVTGANNTIDTTTGVIFTASNAAIGASNATFASLTATGTTSSNAIGISNLDGNTLSGGTVTIAGATGDAINIANASSSTFSFGATTISGASDDGIELNGANGSVTFTSATINGVGGQGVEIVNATTAVAINGGSIGNTNDPGADGVLISGGTGNVTIAASITKTSGGDVVEVNDHDGGVVTFSGNLAASGGSSGIAVTNSNGGTVNFTGQTIALVTGVNLIGNTGSTINFNPAAGGDGLDITTTSGIGFNATGGGTVTVTQNGTTGTAGNTINSTNGTALNISGVTIGASDVTFQSISASGAVNGIALTSTGSSGNLVVTGTGTAGSGGTIQNSTGSGIALSSSSDVSLTNMNITGTGSGAAGADIFGGIAGDGHGIEMVGGSNLTLSGVQVTNAGAGDSEHGLVLFNVSGTVSIQGSTFTDAEEDFIHVDSNNNSDLTLNIGTVTGNTFTLSNPITLTGFEGNGILITGRGTSDYNVNLENSTFNNIKLTGFQFGGDNTSASTNTNITIDNNDFLVTVVNALGNPNNRSNNINIQGLNTIDIDASITNNLLDGGGGGGIQLGADNSSNINVVIQANTVSDQFADGILIGVDENASLTGQIDGNTITNTSSDGMEFANFGTSGSSTMNLTITGNTVTGHNSNIGGNAFVGGIAIFGGDSAGDSTNIDIRNNNVSGNPNAALYADYWLDTFGDQVLVEGAGVAAVTEAAFFALGNTSGTADPGDTFINNYFFNNNTPVPMPVLTPLIAEAPPPPPPTGDPEPPTGDPEPPTGDPEPPTGDPEPPTGEEPEPPAPEPHPVIVDDNILSAAELAWLKVAAIQRWIDAGATEAQADAMRATNVDIAHMVGLYLGSSSPGAILIDSDAAGYGWFLDETPQENGEFFTANGRLYASAGSAAEGHMDLLTVLMHELGHQIGLDDSYAPADYDELMYGYAAVGLRREAEADDLAGADPDAIGHSAYALAAVTIGTLPAGAVVDVTFRATINAQTNGLIQDITGTATATSPDVTPDASNTSSQALDSLTLGGTVWLDDGAGGGTINDGIINGTEAGIAGVQLRLYADTGTTPGVHDGSDTLLDSTVTAAGGTYSFTGLAPGEYIVLIDQDNFNAGGNTSLVATPLSSAPNATDPDVGDPDTDNDDNGVQAGGGLVTSSLAITLAYNSEPTAGTGNDTNTTLDFGFIANQPPVVDLNGGTVGDGIDNASAFTEGQIGYGLAQLAPGALVSDVDSATLTGATVTITDFQPGDRLVIVVGSPPGIEQTLESTFGISYSYNVNTGVATLTTSQPGTDRSPATYQQVLRLIRFQHAGDNPTNFGTNPDRTVQFVLNDGTDTSIVATTTVAVTGVDDPPANVVPASYAFTEDTVLNVLAGIQVNDPDNNSGDYTVHFQVRNGTLLIGLANFTTTVVVAGNNGTNGITLRGPLAEINSALAAGDLRYTPDPNFNGTADALTVTNFDGVAADAPIFAAVVNTATPGIANPSSIVSADLDGDGDLDIVYASNQSNPGSIGVRLNNGNGTFGAETILSAGTDRVTTEVIVGQFNPTVDSIPDIAIANYWSFNPNLQGGLGIFFGTGGGNFGAVQNINDGTALASFDLLSGDFDNDGDLDIVMNRRDNSTGTLYRSNGNGTFTSSSFALSPAATNVLTDSIVSGDFNNDGRLDIIGFNPGNRASGSPPGTISLVLNAGGGAFQVPTDIFAGLTGLGKGVVEDFNGDGNLDLAYVLGTNILFRLGAGNGSFGAATSFAATNVTFLAAGDVNGDGRPDLVSARDLATDPATAYIGNGDGTFQAGIIIGVLGSSPDSLALGDFDGDGDIDLAAANVGSADISVLLNSTANRGDTDTSAITVAAVNDAPVAAAGLNNLSAINEDNANPPGITISAALSARYSDTADAQSQWPGGSSAGSFSGIAVVANGTGGPTGEWQYSTDGTTWSNIGTASATTARLFNASTQIRFLPAPDFNGAASVMTVRLMDNSFGAIVDGTTTANLSGVGAVGGTTPFSLNTVDVGQPVNAVNDAPVLNQGVNVVLNAQDEDSGAPSGAVGTLVSSLVDLNPPAGGLDNVTDVDAGAVTGVAIVDANTSNGSWFYSLDGGTNWLAMGAVTSSDARLLAADADNRIYFQPNADFNGTTATAITFLAWDQASGSDGALADASATGGTTAFSSAFDIGSLTVNAVNDAPVIDLNGAGAGIDNSAAYTENAPSVIMAAGAIVGDVDNATLASATVSVGGFLAGDRLTLFGVDLTSGSSFGTINYSYNSGTGVMTFTSTGSGGTLGQYQTLLQSLKFSSTSDDPTNGGANPTRSISWVLNDGAANSIAGVTTVTITAVNDAPVLNAGASPILNAVDEDAPAPLGVVGTLVSALVDFPGGGGNDNVTDPDGGALTGIAVTAVNSGAGTLYFSLNGGANWQQAGSLSDSNALLLAADADTRVYFRGGSNINGGIGNALIFRAWDRANGIAEGNNADTGSNGTTTAFSSATDSISIAINPVNDAPVLAGFTTSVTFAEDLVNATPQLLDTNVTFSDLEGNFNGGTLRVSGLLAEDTVAIRDQGTDPGQIGLSGADVTFGGVVIGSFSGGSATTLTVTLNGNATPAATDALIQNLTYANSSDAPTASRTLRLNVTDEAGADLGSGTATFTELTGAANPFGAVNVGVNAVPGFTDLDGDCDLDAVVGTDFGSLRAFLNNGPGNAFTELVGAANPFDGIDVGDRAKAGFVDLDGDGDLDAVVGELNGTLLAFRNNGVGNAFTAIVGAANPFDGFDVGNASAPGFIDLDGDGYRDAVIGNGSGTLSAFRNNGPGIAFTQLVGAANPFDGLAVDFQSTPSFVDLDGDGDPDAFVGANNGFARAFRNNGPNNAFTEMTGAANPFNLVDLGTNVAPGLADLDGDGDLDLVLGELNSPLRTFRNDAPHGQAFTVNVTAVNDPPVISLTANVAVDEDDTLTLSTANGNAISIADPDIGSSPLLVTLFVNEGTLTLASTTGLTFTNAQGDALMSFSGTLADVNAALAAGVTYVPDANYNGSDAISVTVNDQGATGADGGAGTTDSEDVNITVNSVNDAPSSANTSVTGSEDDPVVLTASLFAVNDPSDSPPNTLAGIFIESLPAQGLLFNNNVPIITTGGFISFADINDGGFVFIPELDEFSNPIGSTYASFDFRVQDDGGTDFSGDDTANATNTLSIVIDPDNIAPVAQGDGYLILEDQLLTVPAPGVLGNDTDDGLLQPITAELVSGPSNELSFTFNADGSFSYQAIQNFNGGDSFSYRPFDGQFYGNIVTVSIGLDKVNDAPEGANNSVSGTEDTDYVFAIADFPFSDLENDNFAAVRIDTLPAAGTLLLNGGAVAAGQTIPVAVIAGGQLAFDPGADGNGAPYASFTFSVVDDGGTANGGVDTDTVANVMTIDIAAVNDAPVSAGESYDVNEDALLGVGAPGVLGNDGDIDGDGITAILVDGPDNAQTFTFNADGSFSYRAAANYNGPDSFTYRATDGAAPGNIVTVSLNVTPVDDPSTTQPDQFYVQENVVLNGFNLFANNGFGPDSDADGPALQVTEVNGSPANVGTLIALASGALLQVNADGNFAYSANGNFNALTIAATGASNLGAQDSFTYRTDAGNTATVLVNVVGVRTTDDLLIGSAGNDVITDAGFNFNDSFLLQQGGNDSAFGQGGNDGFYFGAAYTGADSVDGGAGTDTIALQGNYPFLALGSIISVPVLVTLSGADTRFGDLAGNSYDYDLTTIDSNVAAGQTLTVIAGDLRPGEDLAFDGSADTDGNFRVFAGQGLDTLIGGAGSDGFFFGADANWGLLDSADGGAGIDSIALRGNYAGATAITFLPGSLANIEVIALLSGLTNEFGGFIVPTGFDYDLTLADGNLAAGNVLTIAANSLAAGESVTLDGRLELDGSLRIFLGAGDDSVQGSHGADLVFGNGGGDLLDGWVGADTYAYLSVADSTAADPDRILWGAGDRIDLSPIDANANTAGNQAFTFIGSAAFTGVAGELRVSVTGGVDGLVEADTNGDGLADLAIVTDNYLPVAGDFIL